MPFQKGEGAVAGPGRPKGTKNKKTLKQAAEVLAERGLNPIEEIIKLIESGNLKNYEVLDAWKYLQSYCEGKPMAKAPEPAVEAPISTNEADILSIVGSGA